MTKVILLVEDNPTDEKLTLRAFAKCDLPHEMVVARDGAEALDYLFATGSYAGRAPVLPAVILLDLKLPRIDGVEVVERVRADERTKLLPIVVLTASVEAEDVSRCYTLGVNAYLRKPVGFAQFAATAQTIAVFWLGLNRPPP